MNSYSDNRFYDLLGRKLSGEANSDELKELQELLAGNYELQFLHDEVLKKPLESINEEEVQGAYLAHYAKMMHIKAEGNEPINNKLNGSVKRIIVRLSVAASVLLAVAISWFFINRDIADKKINATTAATDTRSRSKLVLPDGTIVRLNANSKLSYDASFGKTSRDVFLTGEAFFEVVHNPDRPFVVHTSEANIKVLGTVFNVRDYATELKMETSLIKGSIEVKLLKDATKTIMLKPSDKLVIEKHSATKHIKAPESPAFQLTTVSIADSVITETSWVNGKIAFADKPLEEIAAELETKFGVHITITNEALRGIKYRGVFDDADIDEILNILQMVKPFKYKKNNNDYIIY